MAERATERTAASRSTGLLIGVSGALFCMILMIAPDLLPALVGKPGYAWTPINSQQYRVGDAYYYAAWVAEVLRSGIPPDSPTALELAGRPLIESVRWLPLAVSAIPGLLLEDFRLVYIVDFALTALVLFLVPYFIARRELKSAWGGLVAGIAVLFFIGQWWSLLPTAPGAPSYPIVSDWLDVIYRQATRYAFKAFFDIWETEGLQGSFRFINNSISAPLLLLYVLGCFVIYCRETLPVFSTIAVSVMSPLMAFSYPSRTIVAYLVLAGLAGMALLRRKRIPAIVLISIGAATIAILLVSGFVPYSRRVFAQNELWNNIFVTETRALIDRPLASMLLIVTLNKYTLSFALSLLLVWRHANLRDLTIVIGSLACALTGVFLFDMPLLWPRFFDRGIDHLWFMCLMLALVAGWKTYVERNLPRFFAMALAVPIVCFMLAVPVRGFGDFALASAKNLTRFMPGGRWEAVQWLRKHSAPGNVAAALDWDDVAFIPIYTGTKLAVNNMIIGGRSPTEELRRYVLIWKMLGYERDVLKSRLNDMIFAATTRRALRPQDYRNPPLTSAETYAASQIAEAVLYWPYVSRVGGLEITQANKTVNPAFVDWAMSLYDAANGESAAADLGLEYVLISGAERDFPRSMHGRFDLVFENSTHQIYLVHQQPGSK